MCIVQYISNNVLDFFDLVRGQLGQDVDGEGGLGFCAVLFWCRSVGAMLRLRWYAMLVFLLDFL